MAHKKAGGSSRNGRDTAGRRLGIKKYGGESVISGNILESTLLDFGPCNARRLLPWCRPSEKSDPFTNFGGLVIRPPFLHLRLRRY